MFLLLALLTTNAHASDWSKAKYENGPSHHETAGTPDPAYKKIFDAVSKEKIEEVLKQATGYIPVTVNGKTFSITDRYTPASKSNFRLFWRHYFEALGIPVTELKFPTRHHIGENEGHNLEAVLPGKSKDSIVIIVHYDSMGPRGHETENPGVDDDMTGMSTLMETARILVDHQAQLQNTVRFVAADYEEQSGLEGARSYAAYIKALAAKEQFKIIAAIDNEQSGWNCSKDGMCGPTAGATPVDVFSCSGDGKGYNSKALGDALEQVATSYSSLTVTRGCIGANSDHYAMWEIGVPSVVFSEHDPFENPHFDANGGDTWDTIDRDYYFHIAQVGVTFAATLAGISTR